MPGNDHITHQAPAEDAPVLHPHIARIGPTDLADVLSKTEGHRPVIVDVREAGTTGGFIRGAVNVPRASFDDHATVDALVEKLKNEPEIVFHCQHSQQRGPSAASQFLQRLELKLGDAENKPEVKVLRGGFHEFSQHVGNNDQLVDANPLA